MEYSFTVTELDLNYIEKFNNLEYEEKDKFNNMDILIIEDIQFLFGKTRIEEELDFIMKFLHNKKIQIILSCDVEPAEIYIEHQDIKNILWSGLFVPINEKI